MMSYIYTTQEYAKKFMKCNRAIRRHINLQIAELKHLIKKLALPA